MARLASLGLACLTAIALMLLPAVRGRELSSAGHALLTPLLLLVCALFVHGLGYRPKHRLASRLLTPWLLWPSTALLAWWWWIRS